MVDAGIQLYTFTIGILVAFFGLVGSAWLGRKGIAHVLKASGLRRNVLIAALAILLLFLVVEFLVVKPTQQLYFDDDIYQGMATGLLHQGQAWFCDWGSPVQCFMGEILHEPIGMPFNLAIGFALLGVNLGAAFAVGLALSSVAVIMTFLVALLLSKKGSVALFSELLLALSPVLLVWARPSTSDLAMFAYSLVAIFFLLIFMRKKTVKTFAMLAFALALDSYMKIDALAIFVVAAFVYIALDRPSIMDSVRKNLKLAKASLLDNTRFLAVLLLFVIAISPEFFFAYNQLLYGSFDYQGAQVQNSCLPSQYTPATGKFNIMNAEYNICANILFWFNQFGGQYIMQPVLFTALAILGAVLMLMNRKRHELLALGAWFLVFFALYDFFYAGAVTFGVDWRFMLSMIAQASIFGGFACAELMELGTTIYKKNKKLARTVVAAALLVLIACSVYLFVPQLSVTPINLPQAGDARFYEGFVYNESHLVPSDCLVFTYDPSLWNINNRSAAQMSYIGGAQYANMTKNYSCLVADWGFWCYTPNNLCTALNSTFNLTPITRSTFSLDGKTYGFYYMRQK